MLDIVMFNITFFLSVQKRVEIKTKRGGEGGGKKYLIAVQLCLCNLKMAQIGKNNNNNKLLDCGNPL